MPKTVKLDLAIGEYGDTFENVVKDCLQKAGGRDVKKFDSLINWYPKELDRIRKDESFLQTACHLDVGEAAFFARQLEFVKQKTYDVKYSNLRITDIIPVSSEADAGAEDITARGFDSVGKMALVSEIGQDLPRVDIYGREKKIKIHSFGCSYGYTLQEIRNAMYAGVPLQTRKANAAKLAYNQLVNEVGWFADGTAKYAGHEGLLYQKDILNSVKNDVHFYGNWCDEGGHSTGITVKEILDDINKLIAFPTIFSKNVEKVDTVVMPVQHIGLLKSMCLEDSDISLWQFVKKTHPDVHFVSSVAVSNIIRPSDPTGEEKTNIFLAYKNDDEKLAYEIPVEFEQLPVQTRGFEFIIPCHCRVGGVFVQVPKSIFIAEDM